MKLTIVLLLCALFAVGAYARFQEGRSREARGEVKQLHLTLAATRDSLAATVKIAAHTDTVFRTKFLPRYTEVRVTDTVMRGDTVYVRRDLADTTIAACSVALTACQQAGIRRDSVIAQQDRLIKVLEKKPGPCRILGTRCETVAGVAGLVAGVLIGRGTTR